MILVILKEKKLSERFTKKNCKKQIKKCLDWKRKDNKLYVKWRGYGSSFSSWIDKKDIV